MSKTALLALTILAIVLVVGCMQLPAIGAGGLLHPARHQVTRATPRGCVDTNYAGAGVTLRGWYCAAARSRRGTIVYLHGIADSRASAAGTIARFVPRGFDVIAYDSRAHGDSSGDACTYGFFEKDDLRRVIDTIQPGPVVLIGTSLGAAIALQEAADDPRVTAIVAAETFSDLRTVATERAPRFFSQRTIDRAFTIAESQARFQVDAVSPQHSAERIRVPVLLIHGAADTDTPPAHSQRVHDALNGPKRLILVPGAHHNQSLNETVWSDIERWIDDVVRRG
jgi:pimeloyl-ACP methyl ester carboxylesterase